MAGVGDHARRECREDLIDALTAAARFEHIARGQTDRVDERDAGGGIGDRADVARQHDLFRVDVVFQVRAELQPAGLVKRDDCVGTAQLHERLVRLHCLLSDAVGLFGHDGSA